MTTDDLKAARERWVNYASHGYSRAYKFPEEEFRDDSHALARAYVAIFDETPIDEEWQRDIPVPESWTVRQSIDVRRGRVRLMAEGKDVNTGLPVHTYVELPITTRGQVRLLLLAMGVVE